jgi:membrane fusion protein, multidrug efflux system
MNPHSPHTVSRTTLRRSLPVAASRAGALALLLALAACGSDGEAAPQPQQQGRRGGGPPGGMRMAVVETAAVETGTIAREVNVSGVVEPLRAVAVNSQMSGALVAVNVEEGTLVRQGQVLARIDDRELAAQEASIQAELRVREAAYQRAETLRDRQVITMAEYERDRAAYEAARAQLDQLRARRGFATITSPVSGVVTEKRVEAGDVVGPQTRLFTVGEISTMVVRVSVSELDVVQLSPGDRAQVVLDAFPAQPIAGRIRRVFPSADPTTRLVPVEVALEGEAARIARPGFLARVTFALGAREGVPLIPAGALVGAQGGGEAVFVVEEGKAVRRPIRTGMNWQGRVEILEGVETGEAVIVTGASNVRDGSEVRVVSGPGAEAPRRERPAAVASQNPGGGQ